MRPDLVCIAHFGSAIDAALARSRLALEGIPAFVANEMAPGEIELHVPGHLADRALAILQAAPEGAPTEGGPSGEVSPGAGAPRCLICQSSFVEVEEPGLPLRLLRGILLSALPLPRDLLASRKRRCGVCGHRWKEDRGGSGGSSQGWTSPPPI